MRTRSIGLVALATATIAMTATSAWAQPYYARGDFNGWDLSAELADMGGGQFSVTITGLTAGDMPMYKIALADWSASWPGSDGRVAVDAAGEITLHFYPGNNPDGWLPTDDRVGYEDPGHGWDVAGSFNGWGAPADMLADMGGGLYSAQVAIATAGTYDFKFRKEGGWDITVGDNFGNSAANNSFTTTVDGEIVQFDLDLPNGSWLVGAPPPPAAVCGDGILEGTEDCDDGNTADGDCCSSTCAFETGGCDDGEFCNGADTCDGAGTCTHAGDPCAAGGECNATCNEGTDDCFDAAGGACGSSADTVCDDADTCDGGGGCQANNASAATECRPAADACDVAESCDGFGGCPADAGVTTPIDGDGCCPPGETNATDNDCAVVDATVPTVSNWGMIVLVLALAAGLVVWIGRREGVATN